MLEFLQKSKSLKISVFFLICAIISYLMSSITELDLPAILLTIFMICSIFALAFTVYLVLRRVLDLNGLISTFAFFVIFSGALFIMNMLFNDEYLDMAWRYSLVIGGVVMLIKVFKLFFIDKSSVNQIDSPPPSSEKNSQNHNQ